MQPRTHSNKKPRSTQRVRARDLASALREVKGIHGEDALIVSTREVLVRGEDGLAPQKMIEVEVAEELEPAADPFTQSYLDSGGSESNGSLTRRLERLDTLADRMASWSRTIRDEERTPQEYPLARELRATGCSDVTIAELAASFEEASVGGEPSRSAARRHLSKFLRATKTLRFEQIEGEHWFLGRAGSGRTSLVLQLAGQLRRVGRTVAVIAYAPSHEGDLRRLEMACQALEVPAVVAFDARELELAREELGPTEVLLVDTPCYVSAQWELEIPESAQRHLVVPLSESREVVRSQLHLAKAFQPDTLAITQMDLYPRPGRSVDLAVEVDRPVSFLQGRSGGTLRLRLARGESLLMAALGEAPESTTASENDGLRQASAEA